MAQILTDQWDRSRVRLQPGTLRSHWAGPDFFSSHTVTELKHWPSGLFAERRLLTTPMLYDAGSDRYRGHTWQTALSRLGEALVDARLIIIVGNRMASADLEALQGILASWTSCPVDLLLCIDDHSSGHVRLSVDREPTAEQAIGGRTVLLTVGNVPPPSVLDVDAYDQMVCVSDQVSAGMFQVTHGSMILPLKSDGWRLSHIAFHRLIDIEEEQIFSREYANEDLVRGALPLCSIIAETRRNFMSFRHKRSE